MRRRASIIISAIGLVVVLVAGCGGDGARYDDKAIIERLELEKSDGSSGYVLDGNAFCEVDKELLNDADEVANAAEGKAPVVSSREGNVGIKPGTVFSPDCLQSTRKKLSKLDPEEEG